MELTMEDWCLECGKKQGINEPYVYYELEKGHVTFCSEECEEKYKLKLKNAKDEK